ncbi:MAG TPA: tyrosine-type recombinase/integrase [Actinocrinis sp.]|nr:tyrosine-type recombinase/integrase [Actinocrinis sp.]
MRRGELAGAERAGLNPEAGTLDLHDTRIVIDGAVVSSDGKSEGSWRTIALDQHTLKLLMQHVETIEAERAEFGPDYQDHGKLFCWPDGSLPHPDTITRRFQRIAQRAGLPVIKLHEARHSYLTAGRLARADPKALSQRAGHASVAFTMTAYMHGDLDADRELAETMARLILPGALGPDGDDEASEPAP